MIVHSLHYIKAHKWLLFLILPALILHMITMMPSGTVMCLYGNCGMHFWGVHSFDGMWHLEIAGSSFQSFPFRVPTYAGEILSGYNILLDLVLYLFHLIGVPTFITLFKLIPPVWFVLYTLLVIRYTRVLQDDSRFVACALFVSYFASDFGYLLRWVHSGSLTQGNQSFFLQPMTFLLNTQFALSLLPILLMAILLAEKKYDLRSALWMGICEAIAFGLKFYGGVIGIIIIGIYSFALLRQSTKQSFVKIILMGIIVIVAVLLVYQPWRAVASGGIFQFAPFSLAHAVIEEKDMVYMPDLVNARYYLYAVNRYSPRLLAIELFSTVLYLAINFGTRIFGILYLGIVCVKKKNSAAWFHQLIVIGISCILGMSLIQKGDWWNTVQFMYYGVFFGGFALAYLIYLFLIRKSIASYLIIIIFILISIPSDLGPIFTFFGNRTVYIPKEEFSAIRTLRSQPDGVIFTSFALKKNSQYPFLSYDLTGYLSALTGKQVYLGHTGPLTIIGIDYHKRLEMISKMDCRMFRDVSYIYLTRWQDPVLLRHCKKALISFEKMYDDRTVTVWARK